MRGVARRHAKGHVARWLLAALCVIALGCRQSATPTQAPDPPSQATRRGASGVAEPGPRVPGVSDQAQRPGGGGLTRPTQQATLLREDEYVLPGPDGKTVVNDAGEEAKR